MAANIAMYNMKGQQVGTREIDEDVFCLEPRKDILHLMVVRHLANKRQGTQSTLTRSEVRGGGKKPWRQKGTGRARQGSIRAPQWRHGGVALGPKPRKYGLSVNKKVRKLAMKQALSLKYKESDMLLIDKIFMEEYKTKKFLEFMDALKIKDKTLVILGHIDRFVVKSSSNLQGVKTSFVGELNVYEILKYEKLILEESALKKIEEVYGANEKVGA